MRLAFIAAAAALFAVPALAASEPSTPVETKDAAARKDRIICKTSDQIGSRLRKNKSCRTAKEWADLSAQTQDKTREIQRMGMKNN